MPDLIRLRRELHAIPELSDNEQKTAKVITEFFRQFSPDEVIAPADQVRQWCFVASWMPFPLKNKTILHIDPGYPALLINAAMMAIWRSWRVWGI